MKILIVYYNYPQLSATYVEAEIQFFIAQGMEVEVWCEKEPGSPYPPTCKVHRGSLCEAESSFRPDVVHYYWAKMAERLLDDTICPNVTVRCHSFPVEVEVVQRLIQHERIKAVFMFPDQARQCAFHPKVVEIPVAYSSGTFELHDAPAKNKDLVVCATAGLPNKSLETFLEIACLCPEMDFRLTIATCEANERVIPHIHEVNRQLGANVDISVDVPHAQIPALLRPAAFYICTQRRAKKGMPIAVVEALASGCYVLVPDYPWLVEMVGDYGAGYSNPEDAAGQLKSLRSSGHETLEETRKNAPGHAVSGYGDVNVLPPMLEVWRSLVI